MAICKVCEKTFETDKAFHGHLRAHKLKVKSYYEQFYPKLCLHTGRKLQWKDGDDLTSYSSRHFVDKIALNQYFNDSNNFDEKKKLLESYIAESYVRYGYLPSQVEFASLPLSPNYLIFAKYFGFNKFFIDNKIITKFDYSFDYSKSLPLEKINIDKFFINIDTREGQPYRYHNSIFGKLDVGDYALAGALFNNIVVERKSVADFGSTVVAGNDRFRRELDRARESNKYVIVLVEYNIHELYKFKFYGYSNPAFVAHNMRGLIRDYSDTVQFVFGVNREACVKYIPEFLLCGELVKKIDLQLYVDSSTAVFKNHEFTRDDLLELYK